MARYAQMLADQNRMPECEIKVLEKKVEELHIGEKVDVLISEPIGTLLVNERMLETYIFARDHFLKPGGKMFPVSLQSLLVTSDVVHSDSWENSHGVVHG